MTFWKKGLCIMGLLTLIGCAPGPEAYKDESPKMVFHEYFNGPVKAHGIVQNWRGKVTQRFDVLLVGRWNGNQGELEEFFDYYDGRKQHRLWKLKRIDDHRYEGTADDIVGTAHGMQHGNAIEWHYVMKVPMDDNSTIDVSFDDWMFLMNDGALINRTWLTKFGLPVGKLTIMMQKQAGEQK